MSIVLCHVSNGTAIIMSDGKITNTNPNFPVGYDKQKKFEHLTDDVIIGYTGDWTACLDSVKWYKNHITTNPFDDFGIFQNYLTGLKNVGEMAFILVGKHNNKIHLMAFGTKSNFKPKFNHVFEKDDHGYIGIGHIDQQELNRYMNTKFILPELQMEEYIKSVAKFDITVNTNIFTEKINL